MILATWFQVATWQELESGRVFGGDCGSLYEGRTRKQKEKDNTKETRKRKGKGEGKGEKENKKEQRRNSKRTSKSKRNDTSGKRRKELETN